MVAHFARRILLALTILAIVYNVVLAQFMPGATFTASGTGPKRLFYGFKPPPTPHRVIKLGGDQVAIFIGDVHGCLDELKHLLRETASHLAPGQPFVLFFVGDLVNKGPQSSKTVKFVKRLVQGGRAHVVRGNHDEALLEQVYTATMLGCVWRFLWPYGKYHYIKYLSTDDLEFMSSLPYTITIPELSAIVVHAGLVPGVPLVEQQPDYMLRMRSIGTDGPTHLANQGTPWAEVYQASNSTQRIIFGHDSRRRLQRGDKYLGLDTGAVYGDKLSAMIRFPNGTETIVSVQSAAYEHVNGVLLHS